MSMLGASHRRRIDQPQLARAFAQSEGIKAKTDPIDARMLRLPRRSSRYRAALSAPSVNSWPRCSIAAHNSASR